MMTKIVCELSIQDTDKIISHIHEIEKTIKAGQIEYKRRYGADYTAYLQYIEKLIPQNGINKSALEEKIYDQRILKFGRNKIKAIVSWLVYSEHLLCLQLKQEKIIMKKTKKEVEVCE